MSAPEMWVPPMDAIVSRWFKSYEEAKASLDREGGFLFPHRGQFFVTEREAVRELGLDPDDPDWARIGHDWVEPADAEARERLALRRAQAALDRR